MFERKKPRKIKERRYHLRAIGEANTHHVKMKAVGFPEGPSSGISSHYCFRAEPELGLSIACQRFFCNCHGCTAKLNMPRSERYSGPISDCKFWPIFKRDHNRGWNDVSIVRFEPGKGYDVDEDIEMLATTMNSLSERLSSSVKDGGFGGYSVDDGEFKYYLVKWVGVPRRVERDETITVEANECQLQRGEWICEAVWLDNVPRAKFWFTVGGTKIIVRLKHVLHSALSLQPISDTNKLPNMPESTRRQTIQKGPLKLSSVDHDFMMDEAHRRVDFDHEEEMLDVSDSEDDSSAEGEDEEGFFSDEYEEGAI